MAKRKRTYRRYARKAKRWVKKQKLPVEVAAALISLPFTPARTGWGTIAKNLSDNYFEGVGLNLTQGFIGFHAGEAPNLGGILNPFNFEHARFTKMLIVAGLVSKIRKRMVKIPFNKIPLIGSMVS